MAIYTNKSKGLHGFFLIEVLITTVVVAFGLLSLASLQGGFMSSSGESKARTEAVMLAEAKLEELRNNIIKGNYDAVTSSAANETITGTNATFSRRWIVSSMTAPGRKKISVIVTWGAGGPGETVNLVSELVWSDASTATDYATRGNGLTGKIQSPNNNSSAVDGTEFVLSEITGEVALDDGSDLIKYDDNKGHIYLLDSTGKALIKFNGGVIHAIKGKVFSGAVSHGNPSLSPLTDYPVTFSDLAYCVFPVTSGQSDYICYFGGDCSNAGSGCPNQTATDIYSVVFGGWYGKVGLLETSSTSFHNKKVCFAEDIASDVALTATTTARLYATQRLDANNVVTRLEGINQSFACQDFLVVGASGNSNDCHYFQDFTGISVPSSSVQRALGVDEDNVSLAENVSSCGTPETPTVTYTITGGIAGDQANLVSVFVNGNSCTITGENDAYSYSCTITTVNTTTSLTIAATGGNVAPASTQLNVTPSQTTITGPTLTTSTPETLTYLITGVISGDSASQVTISLADGHCWEWRAGDGVTYYYLCWISSKPTTVTIAATGGNVTLETGSVAQVSLVDVVGVVGPNFVATTATSMSYTITGPITGSQANSVTLSMSNGGICTNNNNGTYSCTITLAPGTVTISASGGNVSPTSDTAILAGVTPVTGPSFHADNLASCAVTVTANITKGTGNAKDPGDKNVTVSYSKSSPTGTGSCTKSNASGIYTYSCDVGSVNNLASVTMSGAKVSVGTPNPVPVTCTATPLILTGPILITTN